MAVASASRVALARPVLLAILSLFLIPALTLAFTRHVHHDRDAAVLQDMDARIEAQAGLSVEEKRQAAAWYRAHPLSTACNHDAESAKAFGPTVCERFSSLWQFEMADRVALWALASGLALFVAVLVLGVLAFANRKMQYASFVAGWRLTTVASAATVAVQSAMVVWLSFWVTAYWMERYYIKLVALAGIAAALAVFFAVRTLFRRFPSSHEVDGESLAEADAPRLWERVRQLAARLGTSPPDHIVAGIDANFFVTEAPCTVGGTVLHGRTLFVSIPLLRVLDQSEADAVLAHELAHLEGGDTQSSAALGPKLLQFDVYCWQMRRGGLTIVAYHLLRLYRILFAFALGRDSREREFTADRVAAGLVTPPAVVRSLVKIAAYASYRSDVERDLFAQDRQHGEALGIAGFVASGLHPYATSARFVDAMKTAGVPHPYDSHPPLAERMRNVAHPIAEDDYGAIVTTRAEATWADEIVTADAIEERLWRRYEAQFAESHEQNLAYRFEPANDDERAIVLKYFPPVVFAAARQTLVVDIDGIHRSGDRPDDALSVPWVTARGLLFNEGNFGAALIVTHHDKALLRRRTTKIKLRRLGKQKKEFKAAVGRYWQRDQVMRAYQAEHRAEHLAGTAASAADATTTA